MESLELLTELAELVLLGAPGGGGTCEAAFEIEAVDDVDEPDAETRSLRSAARVCERSTSSVLTVADSELVDEEEDEDEAEDLDEAEDADDAEDVEDVEDEDELESSAARRSLRSVSSAVRRLLALDEFEADESGEVADAPGGGPPAPPGPPESEADVDVDPSEAALSCARNASTAADRLTALEGSTGEVDVLADEALVALEFDWPPAPFWPAMLACNNRRRRLCWLFPETERFIERPPVQNMLFIR